MAGSPSKDYRREVDAVYPEPLSRLEGGPAAAYRRSKKRAGGSGRYRTTPVTCAEIKEVDEEVAPEDSPTESDQLSTSELDLRPTTQGPHGLPTLGDNCRRRVRPLRGGRRGTSCTNTTGSPHKMFNSRTHTQVIPEVTTSGLTEAQQAGDVNSNCLDGPYV